MAASFQVTFDAADVPALAEFWMSVLGYKLEGPPNGYDSWEQWARDQGIPEEHWDDARALVDPDGQGPRLFFQKVPEPKTAKNRLHLDVNAGGGRRVQLDERRRGVDAEVDRLVGEGASRLRATEEPGGGYYVVMQDPEGNEFCLQ